MRSLRTTSMLSIPRLLRPSIPVTTGAFHTRAFTSHAYLPSRSTSLRQPRHGLQGTQTSTPIVNPTTRNLATTSSGYSQGDEIVEELQELYETAKDEFEIATESTDGATIYAASDRESARDALNHLLAVYSLYTTDIVSTAGANEPEPGDQSEVVETGFDPATIPTEVRDEVKRRVGQRVRELVNAVEVLEERAKAD